MFALINAVEKGEGWNEFFVEVVDEALNQGADAYVTKPVKPAKLLALIKEKLEEQQQAAEDD